jgi:hypothetical protein
MHKLTKLFKEKGEDNNMQKHQQTKLHNPLSLVLATQSNEFGVWRLFIQEEGDRESLNERTSYVQLTRHGQQSQEALLALVCLIIC